MLAYDVLFGIPSPWGTVGEVRNDIDFETDVLPKLVPEPRNIANFPKWEFIRLVSSTPGRGITPPPPPGFFPGWAITDFFFLTEARAELQRRAGGPYVENLDHNYSLTAAERAYLAGIGLPGPVVDSFLAQMNARRNIQAAENARNYVKNNTNYNGKIKNPVLTLHTVIDPLVVVANESAYAELIASTGRGSPVSGLFKWSRSLQLHRTTIADSGWRDRFVGTYWCASHAGSIPRGTGLCAWVCTPRIAAT